MTNNEVNDTMPDYEVYEAIEELVDTFRENNKLTLVASLQLAIDALNKQLNIETTTGPSNKRARDDDDKDAGVKTEDTEPHKKPKIEYATRVVRVTMNGKTYKKKVSLEVPTWENKLNLKDGETVKISTRTMDLYNEMKDNYIDFKDDDDLCFCIELCQLLVDYDATQQELANLGRSSFLNTVEFGNVATAENVLVGDPNFPPNYSIIFE